MALKRHHKIVIGSFSSLLVILLIANSIFIYILYGQLQLSYNQLESEIRELQTDTQSKLNELTENLITTQNELQDLNSQVGSIDEEFNVLKASVGEDFSGVIEDSIKGVVTIRTDVSQGTGFIIHDEGYVVTNYHVIQNAKSAAIYDYNGDTYIVQLIGFDETMDVALLKIEGNFHSLELGNSDKVQIGEKVVAIGNPLGLQFSVSQGIVSAIHREGINGIEAYIQTDAALNPGNSGGPLINTEGEVIGINNFKVGGGESLGFALESNYLEDSIEEIAITAGLNQTII